MATLFANEVRKNDYHSAVHDSSDVHNFRLNPDNPNYDPALSKNNHTEIYNQQTGQLEVVATPTQQHLKSLRQFQQSQVDEFLSQYKGQSTRANDSNRKEKNNSRTALKKWIESDKTHDTEKQFFVDLLEQIEAGQGIQGDLKTEFMQLTEGLKVSRFNDKIRRLEAIEKLDFERADRRKIKLTTKQTEYLFKAPDRNGITFTNDEMLKMVDLWQQYFPDYQVLYKTIHHDEDPNNPHLHFAVSNFNERTKQFDLVNAETEALAKYYKRKHKTQEVPECLSKTKARLTEEEQKEFGKIKQNFFFDLVNRATKNKYNFTKRTPKEVAEADHQYEKNKPIVRREHNRQNKLKQQAERLKREIKQQVRDNQEQHRQNIKDRKTIEAEQQEIRDEKDNLFNQKMDFMQVQQEFQSFTDKTQVFYSSVFEWADLSVKNKKDKAQAKRAEVIEQLDELTNEQEEKPEFQTGFAKLMEKVKQFTETIEKALKLNFLRQISPEVKKAQERTRKRNNRP